MGITISFSYPSSSSFFILLLAPPLSFFLLLFRCVRKCIYKQNEGDLFLPLLLLLLFFPPLFPSPPIHHYSCFRKCIYKQNLRDILRGRNLLSLYSLSFPSFYSLLSISSPPLLLRAFENATYKHGTGQNLLSLSPPSLSFFPHLLLFYYARSNHSMLMYAKSLGERGIDRSFRSVRVRSLRSKRGIGVPPPPLLSPSFSKACLRENAFR